MSSESIQPQSGGQRPEETQAGDVFPAERARRSAPQANTENLDDILADIDSVLASNAEDFVSGFVQKGGQ